MRKRFNQILAVAVMAAILASGCWAIAYAATTGISDSSYNIVENGKSEYVLLLPDDGDAELNMAASEFSTMMEMSSGVKIGTVTDENLSGRTEKVISLGNTSLFSQTGIEISDYNIGGRGYIMKTIGSNLYIASNTSFGVLCGVYDMLSATIGYEAYSYDEIVVDTLTTVPLKNFDEMFKPLIDNRQTSYYELNNSAVYRYRMKLTSQNEQWSAFAHTMITQFCPTSSFMTSHPTWYGNTGGKQICYGLAIEQDNEEGKALFNQIVEQVYANLMNAGGKSKVYIMLGQEDNYVVCTCDRCRAIMDEYGGQGMGGFSAIQIELANLVAEQVDKKLAQDGDTRKIQYGTFAYQTSRTAPAVWDESTQKYVPSSSRFTMRDNVFVLYAPIEMDFSQPLSSEVNKGIYEDLIKWRDILAYDNENNHAGETGVNTADNMMIWSYCIPKNMFTPFQNFGNYLSYYEAFAECGVSYIYDQCYSKTALPGFNALKIYTQSKAMYTAGCDYNQLVYDFIYQYYDVAGDTMYEYYNYLISYYAYLQGKGMGGTITEDISVAKNWSVPVLKKIIGYIEKSLEEIKVLEQKDPERYQTLYDRLMREKCFPMYMLFYRFESDMTREEKLQYIAELEKYTVQFGMTYSYENIQDVADSIASWKANLGL